MKTIETLHETCTGCFACANICPKDAVSLPENGEGFYFPIVDSEKCINCGLCDKVCPQLEKKHTETTKKAYYGWSVLDDVRKQSSSGGIFNMIAKQVLDCDGIVYGASFVYGNKIRLECHSTEEVPITDLMKSKYVQNHIGYSFRQIKTDLDGGKVVLYCGTPCQIAGLKSFLQKEYNNLITADFVCHGVPSMDMLNKHIEYIGLHNVVNINFRPKNTGWVDDFEISSKKKSAKPILKVRRIPWHFDEYFRLFQSYENIRRSCRNCIYCNGSRAADITLADFWGIRNYNPSLWDKRGVSLILANTLKGIGIIQKLQSVQTNHIEELPLEYAEYVYERKRRDSNSPYQNKVRDAFIRDVYSIGYKAALQKHNLKTKKMDILRWRKNLFVNSIKSKIKGIWQK